jgi:autoinducer 2 (AI-2) kinase
VISISDWIALRLCGKLATDATQAGESLLFDLEKRAWAFDLADQFRVPRRLLPDVRPSGTALGRLGKDAARALGLREGIAVGVGAADTQCGLLALGVLSPNQMGALLGTSSVVQRVLSEPRLDRRLWTGHHALEGRWVLESNGGLSGDALEWLAGALYGDTPHPVAQLLAEAAASPAGASGVMSTVGAQVMSADRLGLPLGGVTFSHLAGADPDRRKHLARGALEGLAFALRANAEQITPGPGRPTELRLGGGLCRSAQFCGIVADVIGAPVRVADPLEASALGAAMCAGVAAGVYRDLRAASEALARMGAKVEPDASRAELYDDLFGDWKRVLEARAEADLVASGVALRAIATERAAVPRMPSIARPRILVTAEMDEAGLAALGAHGDVTYESFRKTLRVLAGPDLVDALRDVDVFITEVDVIDAPALKRLPGLKVVASCRGNAVNVDAAACTAAGIPVLYAPGRNADAVADLTVAFILMLARNMPSACAFLRADGGEAGDTARMGRAFAELQGRELWNKTVGLVGLGAVGRGVARRLRVFGASLVVHDPFQSDDAVRACGARPVSLDELLRTSDFVSLHAAVKEGSRGLLGAAELGAMKPGAFLVNTARAALVDEGALIDALRAGRLGGAALDVFRVEPPGADDPLLALPNVIATPHVGGNTVEVAAHQGALVAEELTLLLNGERPRHLLNPEVMAGFRYGERPAGWASALDALGDRPPPAVSDLEVRDHAAPAPPGREPAATRPRDPGTNEKMAKLLEAFGRRAAADPAICEASKDMAVTMHYVLPDVALELHLVFDRGRVEAKAGPPPKPAPVRLKMRAEIFDQVFTGRLDPAQAAMTGKLSFTGDTRLAMGLQRLKADMTRVYSAAREEVGGPGELPAVAPARPKEPGIAPVTRADDPRAELVAIVKELYGQRVITSTGGNVSARIPGTDEAWITPGQVHKGSLSAADLVRVRLDGEPVDPDAAAPSSERLFHCAVLRARPDVNAVVHAHAPKATALALAGLPFLPINAEAAFLGELPRVPFIMPGTQELADAVAEALGKGSCVMLVNHGLLVAAATLRLAADLVEIVERTSELLLDCHAVGRTPPTLPDDIVKFLREAGRMVA